MGGELYYHSFLNRDRLVHIVDGDVPTCEALSVLFRLEGFQTVFSVDTAGFTPASSGGDRMWSCSTCGSVRKTA